MKVLIDLRSSASIRWLRNVLRTSTPLKLGKTSYLRLLGEEEEEAMGDDRENSEKRRRFVREVN
ncbi:hypothetical protein AXX17_AT4G20030 [Arabidopsis thaliana]|uniref:Uncharacterized protein n=1 Tax=Arabidopsis thaliana TaxID=3702 RepID=A0A178V0W5_ARATH|nr:hypothetical protein AXX17_AT4G20030 [Arabidopsis thaliana]